MQNGGKVPVPDAWAAPFHIKVIFGGRDGCGV